MLALGVPVVGVLMGGIYSMPAIMLTKGREPWLSGLLAAGLAVTVFGIGAPSNMPLAFVAAVWGASLLLLLGARALHGSLDGNLERFGQVHAVTLVGIAALIRLYEP